MTTDITELAQSLKAAAEKSQIEEGMTWFSEEQLSHEDGIALHKADAEFIAMANPTNTLALVEVLEKVQTKAVEQGRTSYELFDEVTTLRQRIAELESRTVTVKLVDINEFLADVHDKTLALAFRRLAEGVREADIAALTAQGIKWEAE